jgi:hypothetical protein
MPETASLVRFVSFQISLPSAIFQNSNNKVAGNFSIFGHTLFECSKCYRNACPSHGDQGAEIISNIHVGPSNTQDIQVISKMSEGGSRRLQYELPSFESSHSGR